MGREIRRGEGVVEEGDGRRDNRGSGDGGGGGKVVASGRPELDGALRDVAAR